MREGKSRRYKKRTWIGYFSLSAVAFFVGAIYGIYEDVSLKLLLKSVWDIFENNLYAIVFAEGSSIVFYFVFFKIRENIEEISRERNEKGITICTHKEEELTELRNRYVNIKKSKREKTDESVNKEDILNSKEQDYVKSALQRWMDMSTDVKRIGAGYTIGLIVISLFMWNSPNLRLQLWRFFVPYATIFFISTLFYTILFEKLCIKSFIHLSYSVLYPTVLTIAVNIYFGLSVDNLCTEEFQISTYIPIIMFGLFFIISAGIEFLSYKKEDNKKNVNFSTYGFVIISILALIVSISIFFVSTTVLRDNSWENSFSNLLFSIALALYLGIYEGWDSLRNMNIDEKGELFVKHYRWWNFLQICYPLAFFFLTAIVRSEIFTFGIMLAFAVVSVISTIVWKHGGEKDEYSKTNWGLWKLIFGGLTVVLIFINRFCIMNGFFDLKFPPARLNANEINIELIVVLLGALNGIFIFLGISKEEEQKKFVLMALPLKEVKKYEEFIEFCRNGYIYDFCVYVYLIYILIFHVLLFRTGFLPEGLTNSESAATILLILMIIIYMFLSFKTKFLNTKNVDERKE